MCFCCLLFTLRASQPLKDPSLGRRSVALPLRHCLGMGAAAPTSSAAPHNLLPPCELVLHTCMPPHPFRPLTGSSPCRHCANQSIALIDPLPAVLPLTDRLSTLTLLQSLLVTSSQRETSRQQQKCTVVRPPRFASVSIASIVNQLKNQY